MRAEEQPETAPVPTVAWPPVTYWARTALVIVTIIVGLQAMSLLQNVLLVILASFVFAIGLQLAVTRLERRGWSRGMGVLALLARPVAAMGKVIVTEFYLRRRIAQVRAANAADDAPLQQVVQRPEPGQRPLPS